MDRQRNTLLISLMLASALMPGGHGYAASGAVDLPAAVRQLSGAGWVSSATTVDQAAREVPMPEGTLLGAPKQVAALAGASFKEIVALVERNGKPGTIGRHFCDRFYDAPSGDANCAVRERVIEDPTIKRNFVVLMEPGAGPTRVQVYHKEKATGVIYAYSSTDDGRLRRAFRFENKQFHPLDVAAAEQDSAATGYPSQTAYWISREAELRAPVAGQTGT